MDDITRFVGENVILTAVERNTADENHLPLAENLDRLRSARNLAGKPFEVREAAMPDPVTFAGERAAGELCELLYRQQSRAGANLQRLP